MNHVLGLKDNPGCLIFTEDRYFYHGKAVTETYLLICLDSETFSQCLTLSFMSGARSESSLHIGRTVLSSVRAGNRKGRVLCEDC